MTDPHRHHTHEHAADGHHHHEPSTPAAEGRDPEAHRPMLPRSAGRGQWVFLDAFSGISGDMTVAAFVDLGVPFSVVEHAVEHLGLPGVRVQIASAFAGAVGATRFEVLAPNETRERSYGEIRRCLDDAGLEPEVTALAQRIFACLAEAEARVHRVPVQSVHFHEVGAVDSIVDVVAAASCVVHLGAAVACSPLPMGRGFVESRHGKLPLPAPATLECLRGVPTRDAGLERELVTPTGAAIASSIASRFSEWPELVPERIGWGRGTADLPDRPNALRVVLGRERSTLEDPAAPTHVLLECNVDDLTGELAGHAIQSLLDAGALDAWALPITMKKGRPGWTLAALARGADADRLAELVLRESSSIGVRRLPATRIERPRRLVTVDTRFGPIPVKISEGPYGPAQLKPEFDACVDAARAAAVPVREVIAEALRAARELG